MDILMKDAEHLNEASWSFYKSFNKQMLEILIKDVENFNVNK